jgi:microcystin-dependent protein
MSGCKNCYNGCDPVVSDKCVKYTGPSIVEFGIEKGDNIYSVLQVLLNTTKTFLSGKGINISLEADKLCELITENLPECAECSGYNLEDLLGAITSSICFLEQKSSDLDDRIDEINAPMDIGCLEGVETTSGANSILAATIGKLCSLVLEVEEIVLSLENEYVKVSEIDNFISEYISGESALIKNRMVPYVAMEYYGPLTFFDGTGKGTGDWVDVYLCNGQNNTPDKRGRTTVGAIVGMGGGVLDTEVNPVSSTFNPNYALGSKQGTNSVTLNANQIPSHTHTLEINSGGEHTHYMAVSNTALTNNSGSLYDGTDPERKERGLASRAAELSSDVFDYELGTIAGAVDAGKTSSNGSHTHTGTAQASGGNQAHSNIQPTIAAYYIMYIPS